MIDKAVEKQSCTGCKMCGDLCPENAVKFKDDNEGFWYPVVSNNCTNCGMCLKQCPVLVEIAASGAQTPAVYAAWIKDDGIRVKSTSGGLYYALAETALKENRYISGCVFSEDWKSAKHIVGNTYDDLDRIYRSKYFQSDTEGVYKLIEKLLESDEKVLFCGTPCQNAALTAYLGKNHDTLIQCDFICRGMNSPKAHRFHISELEQKYKAEVEFFNFKNKKQGWTALGLFVKFKNGKTSFTNLVTSAWTRGYIGSNLYMRPCCEHCRFKKLPRVSDITLGDYWGLNKNKEDMEKGMSVVMINTEKGKSFYEKTLPRIHSENSTFEQALAGNGCILHPPIFNHKKRAEFFRRIENENFSDIVFDLENVSKFRIFLSDKKRQVTRWARLMGLMR